MIEPKIKQDVYSGASIRSPKDDTSQIIYKQATTDNKVLQQTGQLLQTAGEKWQESIDLGKVSAAEAVFQKELIDYENKLKSRQGWAAEGAGKDFEDWYNKTTAKIESKFLENSNQKAAFRELAKKKFYPYYERALSHERTQITKATNESLEAGITAQIEAATADPIDLNTVNNGVQEIQRRVMAMAIHNGWDENTVKVKAQEYTSKLHSLNFDQLIEVAPVKAEQYLKTYGTQMTANDYVRASTVMVQQKRKIAAKAIVDGTLAAVEPLLRQDPAIRLKYFAAKHAGDEQKMQFTDAMKKFNNDIIKSVLAVKYGADEVKKWGDEIPPDAQQYLQQVMQDFESGKPVDTPALSDLVKQISQQIKDTETRDMAVRELKQRYELAKKAREEQINTNFEQAIAQLNQNGYRLSEIDPALMALLPPSYRKRLKTYADSMGEIKPNWNVYADLRELADKKPDEFMNYDLRKHFGELSKSQIEQLLDIQSRLRAEARRDAEKAGGQKGLKPVATINQMISSFIDKQGDLDKTEKAQFKLIAYDAINAEQKRKGEPLTFDEMQKILLRLTSPVRVDGFFSDSTTPYWKALMEDNEIKSFKIPDDIRNQIVQSFRARGVENPSEEDIKSVYMRLIGKGQ